MRPFDYCAPKTLAEVGQLAKAAEGDCRLLAGGTDLTVGLRHGHILADLIIDLKRVEELSPSISLETDYLRICGGVTMSELASYLTANGIFPALADAARVVGSIQIRNRATLIGNICNASPAADTVPVLVALGAEVEITGGLGQRRCKVVDFILGNRKIDMSRDEVVSAVRIPASKLKAGSAFERITRRRGVDLATVNLCCCVDQTGTTTFAFGAASPVPLIVQDESGVLADSGTSAAEKKRLVENMTAIARPIDDVRATARYRSAMLNVMAKRALDRALAHINPATAG